MLLRSGDIKGVPMAGVLLIGAAAFVLYAISYALSWKKLLPVHIHRKIWNAALVLTFLACAASALHILISGELEVSIPVPFDIFWLHNASGVAFIVIGIFHAAWHLPYFKAYLPQQKAA